MITSLNFIYILSTSLLFYHLIRNNRYGIPPSYPSLRIPGLNAPLPRGALYGYQPGGWGKPPVDEYGRPLYGNVFGTGEEESEYIDASLDKNYLFGQVESDAEEEVCQSV